MTTLIDTNIVIALLDDADGHHAWAKAKTDELREQGPLIVSDIVYCESSVAMAQREEMDEAIARLGLDRAAPSDNALFIAGKAFKRYKDVNKGQKAGVLPDFLIGATAEAMGLPLLTADPRYFTRYFGTVTLITPNAAAPVAAMAVAMPAAPA